MKFKTNKFIFLLLVIFIYSCEKTKVINNNSSDDEDIKKIIILYTNDEHGWIEKSEYSNGAAEMMGLWRENEGYDGDESYLILSGGDNWTGPAISTWFEGESTVDVMNAMEYDASAIGNHEFDFTVDGLEERIMQANFPYLSANIREKASGNIPGFATPYIILDIDDVMVGIIGLTTITTPWSTFPDHVADYDFIDYFSALEEVVPQVKQVGAELLIVIAHICYSEIVDLAPILINMGISVIGGGHCHAGLISQIISSAHGELAAIKTNSYMQSYSKVEISYDMIEKEVVSMEPSGHLNESGNPDQAVANVLSYWRDQTDAELSEIIGYTDNEISVRSNAMHNMVADSWLYNYPDADIAMTNAGGIRQSIPAGSITKEVIIGVLPFQNFIIELQLTGAQVINCTEYEDMIYGGMTTVGGYFLSDGTPIDDNTTYSVLTTDFLYAQDVNIIPFSQYDASPLTTSMNYHQPTIDWITSRNTSSSNPLDNYLDDVARR
ncbi:bifunctional metallophosphatase/5'-nucleotidase [Candidatus Neomarinimicrobiota bacterium]